MLNDNEINRKEEIVNACEKLYLEHSFKEISILSISEKTSFSRPSIYNYFETKEEIFLELFKKEYDKWIKDLEIIEKKYKNLSIDMFADLIANSLQKRITLLKLLAMNIYDMEENSRIENLTNFKQSYGKGVNIIRNILKSNFEFMSEEKTANFIFSFYPFMSGIYPYTNITEKQKQAMDNANVYYIKNTIYQIVYNMILNTLEGIKNKIK